MCKYGRNAYFGSFFNFISLLMALYIIMIAIPGDRTVVDLVHLYLGLDVRSTVHYQHPYIS